MSKPSEPTQRLVAEVWNSKEGVRKRLGRRVYLCQQLNGKWKLLVQRINQYTEPDGTVRGPYETNQYGGRTHIPIDPDSIDGILDGLIMAKALIAAGKNLEDA